MNELDFEISENLFPAVKPLINGEILSTITKLFFHGISFLFMRENDHENFNEILTRFFLSSHQP